MTIQSQHKDHGLANLWAHLSLFTVVVVFLIVLTWQFVW